MHLIFLQADKVNLRTMSLLLYSGQRSTYVMDSCTLETVESTMDDERLADACESIHLSTILYDILHP